MKRAKRPGEGRPSKYDPKYCKEILAYFDIEHFQDKVVARVTGKNDYEKEETKEVANSIRFLSGFARSIGVNTDTLHEWRRVHPEFSETYTRAKELQEEMIVDNASKGLYNPHFTVFAMKNMCGWRDKLDIDHGVTDESYEKMKHIPIAELLAELQKLAPKTIG